MYQLNLLNKIKSFFASLKTVKISGQDIKFFVMNNYIMLLFFLGFLGGLVGLVTGIAFAGSNDSDTERFVLKEDQGEGIYRPVFDRDQLLLLVEGYYEYPKSSKEELLNEYLPFFPLKKQFLPEKKILLEIFEKKYDNIIEESYLFPFEKRRE